MSEQVDVGGRTRTFQIVGEERGRPGRPLVLVFHGSRQNGSSHRRFTGFALDGLADRGEAVVAYLDGYRGNWNDARAESRFPARKKDIDDVAFARAVRDRVMRTHGVDAAKVAGLGYSNGGQMVFRLLHEAPDLLAGAVVVAATMPSRADFLAGFSPAPTRPVPVAVVAGTADRIVPFHGGRMRWWARRLFKVGGETLSAEQTARYFAARNGLPSTPSVVVASHDARTPVDSVTFRQDGRPSVVLYVVRGGGHTVPGPTAAPWVVGRTAESPGIDQIVTEVLGEVSRAAAPAPPERMPRPR